MYVYTNIFQPPLLSGGYFSEYIKWTGKFGNRPILLDMSHSFSSQEPPTPVDSTRSSFTYLEPSPTVSENGLQGLVSPYSPQIAEIISRGEEESERYGGDDIHEPPLKSTPLGSIKTQGAIFPSEQTIDVNMVTWDGPNDPTNPQNWTIRYKWVVTFIIIIMTVNV